MYCSPRGPRHPAAGVLCDEQGPPATQGSATGGSGQGLGAVDRDAVGSLGSPLCCRQSPHRVVCGPSGPGGLTSEEVPCACPQLPAAGPCPGSRAWAFSLWSVCLSCGLEVQLPAAHAPCTCPGANTRGLTQPPAGCQVPSSACLNIWHVHSVITLPPAPHMLGRASSGVHEGCVARSAPPLQHQAPRSEASVACGCGHGCALLATRVSCVCPVLASFSFHIGLCFSN